MADYKNMKDLVFQQFAQEGYETVDWTLYDSLFTTAGAVQTLDFFQNSSNIGKARSNMERAGSLPEPQAFLITSMEVHIFNADGKPFYLEGAATPQVYPINAIMAKGSMSFNVSPKTMFESHMRMFAEQVDTIQDNGTDHKATGAIGSTMFRRIYKLRTPIIILPQRQFSLKMNITTPAEGQGYTAANTLIMWNLNGMLRRNSN